MINEYFFIMKTLQTVHTEMFSFSVFCLVVNKHIEVFDEDIVSFFPFVINSRLNISSNFCFDM